MKQKNISCLRVAILGGTGFVGQSVRSLLESAGMQVKVFSRTTGCDLLDLSSALTTLRDFRPGYIVNCAAMVGSLNYVSDFAADVVDINMRIVLNTYKIAHEIGDTVIINPIANCAYPGMMDLYEEQKFWNGPIHPSVLAYGSTRRMMWVLSKSYFDQYSLRSVNLVVPNMYGPGDSTNPNKTHALNALIIKFLRAAQNNLPEVEVWGTGKPIREWLYVKDFATVVKQVIEKGDDSLELVNIAQKHGCSIKELADLIHQEIGYTGKVFYNTRYQDGSPKKVMDDRYFRQRFPEMEFTDSRIGIAETIEYYRNILPKENV